MTSLRRPMPRSFSLSAAGGRRWVVVAAIAVAAVLVLLAVAQLVLPSIAANRIKDRLKKDGTVESVSVSAFPAIKLLWGHADHVRVRMADVRASSARTAQLLNQTDATHDLDVSIGSYSSGIVNLQDINFHKHGSLLTADARLTDQALARALPPGFSVKPVASADGQLLLQASASLFGFGLAVDVLLSSQDGALALEPVNVPFGQLARITVFSDPRLDVQGVGAHRVAGGYVLTASGTLH
jgi:LmeA-like phospholipid-binding